MFEARLPAGGWPAKMLKVTAVDAQTGEFVVFDSAGDASLVDAVGASCAVPGVWPPVTVGNRRFMDGGVRSVANADLAARYQRVVIVAPVAQGIGPIMPSPGRQAAALAAAGARVALVRPDRAAVRAIGRNVLDVSRRAAAATAGGSGSGRGGRGPGSLARRWRACCCLGGRRDNRDLKWSFNCATSGNQGDFAVDVPPIAAKVLLIGTLLIRRVAAS